KFGGQIERRTLAAELQKLDNSRMSQSGRGFGFLKETLNRFGLFDSIRVKNLEGDVPLQRGVIGFVNDAEAARSQFSFNVIMTNPRGRGGLGPLTPTPLTPRGEGKR